MSMLQKWFPKRKKLSELSLDDVRREEKRMEIREGKIVAQIDTLDGEKEQLFQKGATCQSLARRRIYARRFNDVMARIGMLDRDLARASKELMTLGRIRACVEQQHTPLEGLLGKLDEKHMAELSVLMEDEKIGEEMYIEKLDALLGISAEGAMEPLEIGKEGINVLKAWEAMDDGDMELDEALRQAQIEAPASQARRRREPDQPAF